jgi:fermentation-respiration switch protein FrsA (DUF1100 family)
MRAWRLLAIVLGAILVLGLLLPAGLWYLRLHPVRVAVEDDPGEHGIRYEPVSFSSPLDGTPLKGWYMPASPSTGRAIVIAPGIDDNRLVGGVTLDLAPTLIAAGFDVLAFDLRGEGESGGGPITFGAREQWDVLGAVEEARSRGAARVGVLAFSLGAGAAILAAARSDAIDALVTDSAFADLGETLRRELERDGVPAPIVSYGLLFYPLLAGTDLGTVSPVSAIGDVAPRPILLIHGTADETVGVEDSERLLAAAGASTTERWLVPGGRHTRSYFIDPEAYAAKVSAFFERAMP